MFEAKRVYLEPEFNRLTGLGGLTAPIGRKLLYENLGKRSFSKPANRSQLLPTSYWDPPASPIFNQSFVDQGFPMRDQRLAGRLLGKENTRSGERHCFWAAASMVAGGGFEPPTFGL
jgi:hypothetical protein